MDKKNKDTEGKKTVKELYNLDWEEMSEEELEIADEMANIMFYCTTPVKRDNK